MELAKIIQQLKEDPRNQAYTQRGIPPIFQINSQARILLIGQAPGRKVEETKIPFNDKSGDTLRQWLDLDREIFYGESVSIMPMDFYYPGKGKSGDLPPRKFIAEEYHAALRDLMPEIKLTLLIGSYAIKFYLKKSRQRNLTETVRHYQDYLPEFFPLVHPSPLNFRWQRNNPWFKEEVIPVLQQRVRQALQ